MIRYTRADHSDRCNWLIKCSYCCFNNASRHYSSIVGGHWPRRAAILSAFWCLIVSLLFTSLISLQESIDSNYNWTFTNFRKFTCDIVLKWFISTDCNECHWECKVASRSGASRQNLRKCKSEIQIQIHLVTIRSRSHSIASEFPEI